MQVDPSASQPSAVSDERAAVVERLYARSGRGAEYGLERVRRAFARLGDPQNQLAVVHVAGTNGKGSVCATVEAIARAAGLTTGLSTSPHLCRLNERIAIDGVAIDDAALTAALDVALADPDVTFFEAMTIAAVVAMRRADVDLAILEVGLGGRLDATNVVDAPWVTAITSIGLDHVNILGGDVATIAGEKAGIARADVPLVVGPVPVAAEAAIRAHAATVGAPITAVGEHVHHRDEDGRLTIVGGERTIVATPALRGPHQADNAAVAAAVAWHVGDRRGEDWSDAIATGIGSARWPGRLEHFSQAVCARIPSDVSLWLDCAHNEDAAVALARALAGVKIDRLLFGTMGDKGWHAMLTALGPVAHRYYCEPLPDLAGRKPTPPSLLAEAFPGRVHTTPDEALAALLADVQAGETVLVCGSIFLVGTVRSLLTGEARDVLLPL